MRPSLVALFIGYSAGSLLLLWRLKWTSTHLFSTNPLIVPCVNGSIYAKLSPSGNLSSAVCFLFVHFNRNTFISRAVFVSSIIYFKFSLPSIGYIRKFTLVKRIMMMRRLYGSVCLCRPHLTWIVCPSGSFTSATTE